MGLPGIPPAKFQASLDFSLGSLAMPRQTALESTSYSLSNPAVSEPRPLAEEVMALHV